MAYEVIYTSKGRQRAVNIKAKTIRFEVAAFAGELPEGTHLVACGLDGFMKRVNCLSGFLSNVQQICVVIPGENERGVRLTWEPKDGDFDAELAGELTSFNMELEHTNRLMRECVNEARLGA